MLKYAYVLICALFFGAGAYVWKVKNTGAASLEAVAPVATVPEEELRRPGPLVEIQGDAVTEDDVDWEYDLVTQGIAGNSELTQIPDLGTRYKEELKPLRKALIANIIERKVLFKFVQQDKSFIVDEPGRFATCMNEFQDTVTNNAKAFTNKDARNRLKTRLCERSILDQYMKEKLFSSLAVSEQEALEYYKNHRAEYKAADRVTIRQIVVANEGDAKRIRNTVNAGNFEEFARTKSIAPEAEAGGKLGPFTRTAIPSLFDMAYQMKKGEISPIVKTPYGYHIMLLLDKEAKEELGYDVVKKKIIATLRKKREEDEYQKWVEKALAAISVNSPKPLW
jgi:peptidyl-prolyl cis-trans isomerase C